MAMQFKPAPYFNSTLKGGKTSQILNTGINVRDAITVDGDVRLTVI
jgi:hypothetical protein